MSARSGSRLPFRLVLMILPLLVCATGRLPAEEKIDHARNVLDSARRAFNDKKYEFAATRFREFLSRYGGHAEAASARYGLALALMNGPTRDYQTASSELQALVGNQAFPDHPFALYYLGSARRALGMQALARAMANPQDANGQRNVARDRFSEAAQYFAQAQSAFARRAKRQETKTPEEARPTEWAARACCDLAEMQLRLGQAKQARETITPLLHDKRLARSRSREQALYYHGFACFLLKDYLAAGRSLSLLTPFRDPVFGPHARYLLARIHQLGGERQEALLHYQGVLADHARRKQEAVEALKQPQRFHNDPEEKTRLEKLVQGPAPDPVARALFFLGVLEYENGHFDEALKRLSDFAAQFPHTPLTAEAQLRRGFCLVQLKQFAEAQKILQPLADREPMLADQALLWLGKAQVGAADAGNGTFQEPLLRSALDTLRRAADRAGQRAGNDPEAKTRRGEILLELADTRQLARQFQEAAAVYRQILDEKLLPRRAEEVLQHQATALHRAGALDESDRVCERFRATYSRSVLLPAVLFRYAENAYFRVLAAEKIANPVDRARETARHREEAIGRFQAVIEKYPEFPQANLARHALAMVLYRTGDVERARKILEAIPAAERTGELAVVPYALADCLIRQAPAHADDAVAAGRLEEQLRNAIELLEGFVSAQPNAPQTPDALLKLGYCQQRLARLLAQAPDQDKALAAARAAYEQIIQRFPRQAAAPQAYFERAKCQARAKDVNGAINELRRFTSEPLRSSPVAPLALLHLATLLRSQNRAAEAASVLAQCRKDHETALQNDPTRAGWVPLLQFHQAVALREAGKLPEARTLFEGLARQTPERPESWQAALHAGQCRKEESLKKLAEANRGSSGQDATRRRRDEGLRDLREAAQYLRGQADLLKRKKPEGEEATRLLAETRARMLYDAAWAYRELAKQESEGQKTGAGTGEEGKGKKPVPLSAAEREGCALYRMLIDDYPDLPLSVDARFELAELHGEHGDQEAAGKLLNEALDKEPSAELTDKVRVRLGASLLAKGDAEEAREQLQPVADNPQSPLTGEARYQLSECYRKLGRNADAVKTLAVFRDQGPFQNLPGVTERALLRLGHLLGEQKQWSQSRQAYEQLVNRFGNSPWVAEARYGIGWAYQNERQYDAAVNSYQQVVERVNTETAARAQLNIGLCRLAQKRHAEASTALLVVPYTYDYPALNALALTEAAQALAENKRRDQAIKLLQRVLRDYADTEAAQLAQRRLAELKNRPR